MSSKGLTAIAALVIALLAAVLFAQRVPQGQWVYSVAFSPDGKQVLSGGASRKIQLWDVTTGRELKSFDHPGWLQTVAFSPDGKRALTGTRNRTARLWDLESGRMLREVNHRAWATCVIFLPDGKSFLSIGGDDKGKGAAAIRVWETDTGRELRQFGVEHDGTGNKHGNGIGWGSLSADGSRLATCGGGETIVWNVETGEPITRMPGHKPLTWEVALSPDGKTCVTGGSDKIVRVWRVKDGRCLRTLKLSREVRSLAISADGKLLAAGTLNGKIRLWKFPRCSKGATINAHKFIVESLDFSPDGKRIVSGAFDGTVKLWNAKTGKAIWTWR